MTNEDDVPIELKIMLFVAALMATFVPIVILVAYCLGYRFTQ